MCHVTYLHQNVKYSAFNDYKKEIPKLGGYKPWAEHLSASIHPDLCLARAVVCDKTVPSRSLKTFFAPLGEPAAELLPWASANVKWPRSHREQQRQAKGTSGKKMTDDKGRSGGRMCEGRERRGEWRGCESRVGGGGLKRRNGRTWGEERRSDSGTIIIGSENLAVTSAPLLEWHCVAALHLPPLLFQYPFQYPHWFSLDIVCTSHSFCCFPPLPSSSQSANDGKLNTLRFDGAANLFWNGKFHNANKRRETLITKPHLLRKKKNPSVCLALIASISATRYFPPPSASPSEHVCQFPIWIIVCEKKPSAISVSAHAAEFTAGGRIQGGSVCFGFFFGLGGKLTDIFIVREPAGLAFMKPEEIAQKCTCLQ